MYQLYKFFMLLILCCSVTVHAQTVRIIVPFAQGGFGDRVARVLEKTLANKLPYNFIVDYQLGGGGIIASNNVAKNSSKETVLLLHSTAIVIGTFSPAANYDLLKDFVPVAKLGVVPLILVTNRQTSITNIQQLKQANSPLFYATSGIGSANHMAGEILQNKLNKPLTHVPYKGESAGFNDILSNNVTMMFASATIVAGHVNSSQISMIAITGTQRNVNFPNVPTFLEQGIRGFERSPSWNVLLANPGADRLVISQIKAGIEESFKNRPDLYAGAGLDLDPLPTTGLLEFLAEEVEKVKVYQHKLFLK